MRKGEVSLGDQGFPRVGTELGGRLNMARVGRSDPGYGSGCVVLAGDHQGPSQSGQSRLREVPELEPEARIGKGAHRPQ